MSSLPNSLLHCGLVVWLPSGHIGIEHALSILIAHAANHCGVAMDSNCAGQCTRQALWMKVERDTQPKSLVPSSSINANYLECATAASMLNALPKAAASAELLGLLCHLSIVAKSLCGNERRHKGKQPKSVECLPLACSARPQDSVAVHVGPPSPAACHCV